MRAVILATVTMLAMYTAGYFMARPDEVGYALNICGDLLRKGSTAVECSRGHIYARAVRTEP
jgi:hypothetical protein